MRWDTRYSILAVTMLAFFSTMVARLSISPIVPTLTDAYHVSKSQIGLVLTGMWAGYALMQFPSGLLGDRFGERRIVVLALALTGSVSLLLASSPTFLTFAVFVILLGLGAGLYFSVAASLLTRTFDKVGQALGFHGSGGPIAGVLTPIVASYLATQYGWRVALALGAMTALPACLLFVIVGQSASVEGRNEVGNPSTIRSGGADNRSRDVPDGGTTSTVDDGFGLAEILDLLTRGEMAFTFVVAALCFFTWQAFASFFPTFLVQYSGYQSGTANLVFGIIFAISAVGLPTLGRLSDVFGRDFVLTGSLFAGAVGYVTFFIGRDSLVATVLGIALLSIGLSWTGVLNSRIMDALASGERTAGFGLIRTLFLLVSSTGSVVTGTLADVAGWVTAYGFVAVVLTGLGALLLGNKLIRGA